MQGNQTNIYLHVPSFCRYYVKRNGHSILVMKYLFYPKWKKKVHTVRRVSGSHFFKPFIQPIYV